MFFQTPALLLHPRGPDRAVPEQPVLMMQEALLSPPYSCIKHISARMFVGPALAHPFHSQPHQTQEKELFQPRKEEQRNDDA